MKLWLHLMIKDIKLQLCDTGRSLENISTDHEKQLGRLYADLLIPGGKVLLLNNQFLCSSLTLRVGVGHLLLIPSRCLEDVDAQCLAAAV